MYWFLRINYLLILPMTFIIPSWMSFGVYYILGVTITLNTGLMYLLATIIFVPFFIIAFFIIRLRPDVRISRTVGTLDGTMLTTFYVVIMIHSLTVAGFDESTERDVESFASRIIGDWFIVSSNILMNLTGFVIPLIFLSICGVFLYEYLNKMSIEIELPTRLY